MEHPILLRYSIQGFSSRYDNNLYWSKTNFWRVDNWSQIMTLVDGDFFYLFYMPCNLPYNTNKIVGERCLHSYSTSLWYKNIYLLNVELDCFYFNSQINNPKQLAPNVYK